jgi:hypothetical protein
MAIHFLSATRLVDDLLCERPSQRDQAYYMLAGFIFSIALGYSTLTFSNAGQSWFGLCEFLLLVVTTVYGFERCYDASSVSGHRFFIVDFVCLSLPISITTMIVVWGCHWGGWALYRHVVMATSFESQRIVNAITYINAILPSATVLVGMILSNVIFYLRMISHLNRLESLRQTP